MMHLYIYIHIYIYGAPVYTYIYSIYIYILSFCNTINFLSVSEKLFDQIYIYTYPSEK